jgi:hypothetical protein
MNRGQRAEARGLENALASWPLASGLCLSDLYFLTTVIVTDDGCSAEWCTRLLSSQHDEELRWYW